MTRPRSFAGCAVIGLALIAATGCGDSSTGGTASTGTVAARSAAAVSSCPKEGDYSLRLPITNLLDTPLRLRGYNVDCYDWSAPDTPDVVFDNVLLAPGAQQSFKLTFHYHSYNNQMFNMAWGLGPNGIEIGSSRIKTISGNRPEIMPTDADRTISVPQSDGGRVCLRLQKLSSTGAPPAKLDNLNLAGGLAVLPYEGYLWAAQGVSCK